MKLRALLLLFTVLVFAVPAYAQNETLVSFFGFDYETDAPPDPPGNTVYLGLGDSYYAVGFATSFHPTWFSTVYDPGTYEYTFYQYGLTVDSYSYDANVLYVTFASGGKVDYYEDSSFNAANPPAPPNCPRYGINPPNADSPSKFSDGTLAIAGDLDNASLYYDYNVGVEQGGFSSEMNITGGLYSSYVPGPSWNGWFMTGLIVPPPTSDPCQPPAGYDHQLSGECIHPVTASSHGTWGALKKLYR